MAKRTAYPNVVNIVSPENALETAKVLERLRKQALRRNVIGIAFIALRPGMLYEVGLAGEAHIEPVYIRGLLKVLDDRVALLIGSKETQPKDS